MALPINIKDLIHGHSVEWERLEFKQGWNPEEIFHSICAFANDLHNWGGGYVIIGIAEQDGIPVLPPTGLSQNRLDKIQNELIKLCHQIQPTYIPIVQPYVLDGKHILVLWCPAGDNRPYTALSTQGKGAQRQSYIRVGSNSIIAQGEILRRLQELTARIPFDDRINQTATIQDFDLGLIQAFLQEVKSDLYEESKQISLENLTRSMLIAKGSDEYLRPVNVGLLFFSKEPERFFPRSWIEVVCHRDDVGDNFTEHYFKGPLHKQLRDALSFIKTNIIHEHVKKIPNQAESLRFYNFPYEAVEEALSNAVYHKGYDLANPIEVQIWPDKMNILSYPGPIPPVDFQILQHKKIEARNYRNRRIGDFLKELDLTEGRGSGFPKMYRTMINNGSPEPIVYTDEESILFLTTLPAHPLSLEKESIIVTKQVPNEVTKQASNEVTKQVSNEVTKQVPNEVTKQVPNEVTKQVTKDIEKTSIKTLDSAILSNKASEKVPNEVTKHVPNEVTKQVTKDIEKTSIKTLDSAILSNKASEKVPNEVTKQVPNEVTKQASNEVTKQVSNEVTKQVPNGVTKQAPNEVTKHVPNEVTKQVTKDIEKTSIKTLDSAILSNKASEKVPNEVTKQVPNEVTKQAPNEVTKHVPNEVTKQVTKDIEKTSIKTLDSAILSNKASEKVPNEVTKQVPNEVTKQASNEVTKHVPNEVTKQAPNEVTKQAPNEVTKQVPNEVTKQTEDVGPFAEQILFFLEEMPLSKKEILDKLNMSNQTKNKERHIDPLMNYGWVAYTMPDNPKDMNQKYQLTEAGKNLLSLLINRK